jgi:hypothetical protein
MRPFAMFLTLFALVAAGCGRTDSQQTATPAPQTVTDPAGGGVVASCIAGFTWNGRLYARDAGELEQRFESGEELGHGVEPGCNDTGGNLEPDKDVTVVRIKGVDPEVAVARPGDDRPYFNVMPAS